MLDLALMDSKDSQVMSFRIPAGSCPSAYAVAARILAELRLLTLVLSNASTTPGMTTPCCPHAWTSVQTWGQCQTEV